MTSRNRDELEKALATVVADDGISEIKEIDLLACTPEQRAQLLDGVGGFEWRIGEVEEFWQTQLPDPDADAAPLSLGWYAREILTGIRRVRAALALRLPEHVEAYVIAALMLGEKIRDAQWRFNFGDQVRLGAKVRARNRDAARKPRTGRPRTVSDGKIRDEARRLRDRHPYSAKHSTRWLAREIARGLSCSVATVRDRLKALKLQ